MSSNRVLGAALAAALVVPALGTTAFAPATGAPSSVTTVSATVDTSVAPRVRQRAKLFMHPQLADVSATPRAAKKAKSAMTGKFAPKKKGRPVALQKKKGTSWVTIQKRKQNKKGLVEFTAPYAVKGKVQTYRVVALKYDGLAAKSSKGAKTSKWGAPNFTDEFSGSSLNTSVWSDRLQGYAPASQRSCSKADSRARSIGGGTLQLKVIKDPDRPDDDLLTNDPAQCTYDGKNYDWRLNGHIGTQGTEQFLYGYMAARIKFQPARGQHGAFWSQPASTVDDPGAEIDVIEYFGDNHPYGGLTSFVYRNGTRYPSSPSFIPKPGRFGKEWAQKYHVFSVEWTKKAMIFRIDGKETMRLGKAAVSHSPQYLILSVLSSDYELQHLGGEDKLGTPATTMHVDWVRHWGSRL